MHAHVRRNCAPLRRCVLARLCAAVLLAPRNALDRDHLACHHARSRPRSQRDVRTASRVFFRAVWIECPLQRRLGELRELAVDEPPGQLAPFIATALLAAWGQTAVAIYMMVLATITLTATYLAPETHRGEFS